MRLLITGARGFLGRHLMPLVAHHDVLSLVHSAGDPTRPATVREVRASLVDDGSWQEEVARFAPDCCIHLAWEGLPDYSLSQCRRNLDASVGLIDLLVRSGTKRVVVAGTCWEYGRASGPVAENRSPVDVGVFAATKQAIRTILAAAARDAGIEYRWARIFFVYGAGQRSTSLIPHLHAAASAGINADIREPGAVQDFVHVEDVARGLASLVERPGPSGAFNIGSGAPTSVAEVANLVARRFGRDLPYPAKLPGGGFWADTEKMRQGYGWQSAISIEEGVERTLAELDTAA